VIIIFAKVSKEIIYNKEFDNKRISLFMFLVFKISLDDTVSFSINSIIDWHKLKINKRKGKTNEIFYNLILGYKDLEYLKSFDENDLHGNNLVTCDVNMDKLFPIGNYGVISDKEFNLITLYQCSNPRITTSVILLVLSYIRSNILRRTSNNGNFSEKDIKAKPEFCYRMISYIEDDIGLHRNTISKCIDILVELDILVTLSMPRYKDENGNWHTEATLFADKYRYDSQSRLVQDYDYEEELKYGKQYLIEKKYVSKKFYQNTEEK